MALLCSREIAYSHAVPESEGDGSVDIAQVLASLLEQGNEAPTYQVKCSEGPGYTGIRRPSGQRSCAELGNGRTGRGPCAGSRSCHGRLRRRTAGGGRADESCHPGRCLTSLPP